MDNPMITDDLLTRIESGADDDGLNHEIGCAIGGPGALPVRPEGYDFVGSLNSAMALLPGGCDLDLWGHHGDWRVLVMRFAAPYAVARSHSPARAVTAACLAARRSLTPNTTEAA